MAVIQVTEGMSLWWVGSNNRKTQEEVTVTKVGRKWAACR